MDDALSIGETVDWFALIRRNISKEPNICMYGGKGGSKQLEIDLDSV